MRMREVKRTSFAKLAEYLGVDEVSSAWVEDWEGQTQVETLRVVWSDSLQFHQADCNQDLDVLVHLIEYEE